MKIGRELTCEFIGTAGLLATVVGSGILAHKLDAGNVAVSVLSVALATGCVLVAMILSFGSISCQLNPVVTLACAVRGEMPWRKVAPFIATQIAGAIAGVVLANLMFDLPAVSFATAPRTGSGQWIGELVATFGLLGIIFGAGKSKPAAVSAAVGCYVAGAILFTSSTCFANPAVTIARIFTETLTGIRACDVLPFIASQLAGATAALLVFGWLFRDEKPEVPDVVPENLRHLTGVR